MRPTLSPLAERDLESIGDYISQESPRRALSFMRELRQQCDRIGLNPQGYRPRPELGDDMRSCPYGNYVIFFDVLPQGVTVQRILHAARDLSVIFGKDSAEDDI